MNNKKEIPHPIEFSLRDTICVQIGTVIEAESTLFKVVKKYNDFVWQLKAENGEIVNVFYALSQSWSLHCWQ